MKIRLPSRSTDRSRLVAACLSFVVPGAGQLYLHRWVSAAFFAVISVSILGWAVMQLSHGFLWVSLSMLDGGYALTVMVAAVVFTAIQMAAVAHPFAVTRFRRIGLRATAVVAGLLVTSLALGNFVFSNAFDAYQATEQMVRNDFTDPLAAGETWDASFNPGDPGQYMYSGGPEPTIDFCATPTPAALGGGGLKLFDVAPTPSASASESPTPTPTATPETTSEATPTPDTTASPSPSPSGPPHRMTILLTGVDFMNGRHHALRDSIMLVSVDLRTRAVAMVSIPRDTSAFPFYWGGQAPDTFKINSLINAISAGRFGSPDTPMATMANEIGYLVGVKVDYYAEIDMDGFKQMIDLVGGVDINNPTLLNDPSTCTYVPVGPVHLNGWLALKYSRSRESSNDYARSSRQQIVLVALEKKIATPGTLPKLGSLLALAGKSISTDFPLNTAKNYVDVAEHVSSISRCVLGPPYNFHPDSKLTNGTWTSRLKLDQVANLSVQLFGEDSRYYGQPGVTPQACLNKYRG